MKLDFPLVALTENKVVFEGMTFERLEPHKMIVSVDIHKDDGTTETLEFIYFKD